jgi:hypothetical protein
MPGARLRHSFFSGDEYSVRCSVAQARSHHGIVPVHLVMKPWRAQMADVIETHPTNAPVVAPLALLLREL